MGSSVKSYTPGLFYSGLLIGALGLVFYPTSNSLIGSVADLPMAVFVGSSAVKAAVLGSFPSFTHALATSLLMVSIVGMSWCLKLLSIFVVLALLFSLEVLMGTFDLMDVGALLIGSLIGVLVLLIQGSKESENQPVGMASALLITAVSSTLAVGSYQQQPGCARYEGSQCVESKRFATPVYMSYADLRRAVKLEAPHPLTEINRLYLYKSLIFMNEKNQGVHIIDNRFPANPEPIGFIRIPGNLDINIRDDYLYADSYVDLVTIDLTDINAVVESSREPDIFPFDAFQNIPNNIDFKYELIDSGKGVIVGYE